jgi:hypothetical protein
MRYTATTLKMKKNIYNRALMLLRLSGSPEGSTHPMAAASLSLIIKFEYSQLMRKVRELPPRNIETPTRRPMVEIGDIIQHEYDVLKVTPSYSGHRLPNTSLRRLPKGDARRLLKVDDVPASKQQVHDPSPEVPLDRPQHRMAEKKHLQRLLPRRPHQRHSTHTRTARLLNALTTLTASRIVRRGRSHTDRCSRTAKRSY